MPARQIKHDVFLTAAFHPRMHASMVAEAERQGISVREYIRRAVGEMLYQQIHGPDGWKMKEALERAAAELAAAEADGTVVHLHREERTG
jgi:hypothetical protein